MKSYIYKLIRANELIIKIKKEAKNLSKKTNKPITECQNIISKNMGFFDWYTVHNKVKQSIIKENNILTNILVKYFKSNYLIILSSNKDLFTIKIHFHESLIIETIDNIPYSVILDFYQKNNIKTNFYIENNNIVLSDSPLFYSSFTIKGKDLGKVKHCFIPKYPSGIDIVLKPFPIKNEIHSLTYLGFSKNQEKTLLKDNSYGVFFIAGTSSSGKEDTVNSLAKSLAEKYNIKDIFDFSEFDTNIEIPEIKNSIITTNLLNQQSKNLIFELSKNNIIISSIHASYAFGITSRLKDFNLYNFKIKSLVYQDKLFLLCNNCKKKASTNDDFFFLDKIKKHYPISQEDIFFRNNIGCKHCYFGIKNTTISSEIIEFDDFLIHEKLYLLTTYKTFFDKWLSLNDKNIMSDSNLGKLSYHNALKKMFIGQLCPHTINKKYDLLNKIN